MKLIEWIVSRGFSSFAVVTGTVPNIFRGKAADGKGDIFTVVDDTMRASMNVYGKIKYVGQWPK